MRNDLADRLNAIRERIGRIDNTWNRSVGRCISPDELGDFEAHWRVALPQPYRQFLLTVGNGGIGVPDFGMVRLGELPEGCQYDDMTPYELLRDLHRPFPFTGRCDYDDAGRATQIGRTEATHHGKLVLGTDGCGMNWLLIVTGSERGNIWFEDEGGVMPCVPPRDFLSWYERWLDWVESGKKRSAFYADVFGWPRRAQLDDDDDDGRPAGGFAARRDFTEDDIPF